VIKNEKDKGFKKSTVICPRTKNITLIGICRDCDDLFGITPFQQDILCKRGLKNDFLKKSGGLYDASRHI